MEDVSCWMGCSGFLGAPGFVLRMSLSCWRDEVSWALDCKTEVEL